MFQFFCIVDQEDTRTARRVTIEGDLQARISDELERQVATLLPEEVEIIPYEPGYKPDDEVLVLPQYPLPPYIEQVIITPDALPTLAAEELESGHVKALLGRRVDTGTESPLMAFQNFDSGQVLRRGPWYLLLDKATFQQLDRTGLKIATKVSAVLRNGDLLFQSEHLVRRYLELDSFFRDATDEEISNLLAHDAFAHIDHSEFLLFADRQVRRKITSIIKRDILDRVPVAKIVATGREFEVDVEVTEVDGQMKIIIPKAKRDVKRLLRLLDDDLLESALTDAKYQVTSKRRIR